MRERTLSAGVGWIFVGILMVFAVAALIVSYQRAAITSQAELLMVRGLEAEVELLARLFDRSRNEIPLALVGTHSRRLTLIEADGVVLGDTQAEPRNMDNHRSRPEVAAALASGIGTARRVSNSVGGVMLYAARRLPDGRVLRIAAPLTVEEDHIRGLVLPVVISTLAAMVIGGAIIVFLSARMRVRLAELVQVSQAFSTGQFQRRANLSGSDAIAALGHELNHLGERLHGTLDQLAGQRRLLDGALGALSEGVACLDRMDRVVYANTAWSSMVAHGDSVVGQPFYHALSAAAVAEAIGAFRAGQPAPVQDEFMHHKRHMRVVVVDGGAGVMVIVLHDLTDIKRLELARRDFLSAVSHELKTPLTAIIGFTDTLLDGTLEDNPVIARDFVGRIGKHADRLATLVRDVLTLSRLEQGTWEMRAERVDLVEIIHGIAEEHQASANARTVTLVCVSEFPIKAWLDDELLRQVVGNLVSNAIRYNRPGGTVWMRLKPLLEQRIAIVVEDTGIGVAVEHRERIFERFYRVDAHRSRQTGGTGLGLAIVKHQVQLMGGTVEFSPGENEGSIFTIVLPLGAPPEGV